MKVPVWLLLAVVLGGCASHAVTVPPTHSSSGTVRAVKGGGPGSTSIVYQTFVAPVDGSCPASGLVLMVGHGFPAPQTLSFAAGQGPPLEVSNCNFSTPQYVQVTLGKPAYGIPFIRQNDYDVAIDAPAAAQVSATWTALGPTLPGTPGASQTVNFTIGPAWDQTVLWQTGGGASLGQFVPPSPDDGQCGGPVFSANGSNASFTATRNTDTTYSFRGNTFPGASTCYRNQMNPIDPSTGTNYLLAMGSHYTFTFQTVVTFNGNIGFFDSLPGGHLAVDIPAIVWQTHSYGGSGSPCDALVIQNTYAASVNGVNNWGPVPAGGQPIWDFRSCDEPNDFSGNAWMSPQTLTEGQTDSWQIDIDAAIQGQAGGHIVVHRNGEVVYDHPSHVCDSSTTQCFWNFGVYPFFFHTSEEPSNWNPSGITVQVNDMTFTTPNGAQTLSRRRHT